MKTFTLLILCLIGCGGQALTFSETSTSLKKVDAGAVADGGAADSGPADAATIPVTVAVRTAVDRVGTWATNFPIDATSQIEVAVDYTGLTGTHSERVDVFSPDGILYQVFNEQVLEPRVWDTIWVAGTPITVYHMVGIWTIQVTLDSEPSPRTQTTFTLY